MKPNIESVGSLVTAVSEFVVSKTKKVRQKK